MGGQHAEITTDMENITILPKFNMAATKPEVVLTRVIYHLGLKFQRL
jgi:hypothetical protein